MIAGIPYDAEVEYLESTGTQWIDTLIPMQTIRYSSSIELKGMFLSWTSGYPVIAGGKRVDDFCLCGIHANINTVYARVNTKLVWRGWNNTPGLLNKIFNVSVSAGGSFVFTLGDVSYPPIALDETLCTSSETGNLSLFSYENCVRPTTGRIYSVKVILNGETLYEAIPVRFTNSNGESEGALYDRVSRKLFRNSGTGSFTIGPDVATPVMGLHFFKSQIKTAKDYVQNGLIAMWDGIENAGWGVHEAAATTWKDLIGERDATVASAGSWKDNALHCDGTTYGARFAHSYDGFRTLEACYKFGGGTNGGVGFVCVVSSGNGNGVLINRDDGSFGFGYYASGPYFLGGPTVGASATVVGVWDADPSSNRNTSQYVNGAAVTTTVGLNPGFGSGRAIVFGARQDGGRPVVADIYCLRLYDRALTAAEIAANYAIDKVRFNLP